MFGFFLSHFSSLVSSFFLHFNFFLYHYFYWTHERSKWLEFKVEVLFRLFYIKVFREFLLSFKKYTSIKLICSCVEVLSQNLSCHLILIDVGMVAFFFYRKFRITYKICKMPTKICSQVRNKYQYLEKDSRVKYFHYD